MSKDKFLNTLKILIRLSKVNGIDFFKATVKGERFQYQFEFRLLIYMLSLGIGKEISRKDIIENVYNKENFNLKEKSIDPHVSRINKVLRKVNFDYIIRNNGNPKHPKGFYLAKRN